MESYILISGFVSIVLAICIIATSMNTSKTNDYLKAILEELRNRPL